MSLMTLLARVFGIAAVGTTSMSQGELPVPDSYELVLSRGVPDVGS